MTRVVHTARAARAAAPSRARRPRENVTTRIVTERRWISSTEARIGMYVSALDRPWTETRFMFQGFRIETPEELAELRAVCDSLCVDSEKVARISSNSTHRLIGATRRQVLR